MTIEFIVPQRVVCGETTCASEPGKFCPFVRAGLVDNWHCQVFNLSLNDRGEPEGWLKRCKPCLAAEQAAKVST